jgi:predicted dehydrogenase
MGAGSERGAGGTAVAGTGFIGPVHVEALRRAGVPVVGILGSSPEKSRRAAAVLGVPTAYDSYAQLLDDPLVTAVHLATPNRHHTPMARAALLAGKHVLCEKPLALGSRESADLAELAEHTGLAAGVAYNIRYYPLCLQARHLVASGSLGRIYSVCGSYTQDWLLRETDYNWRVLAEEGGELRAVADIGTHWLDLLRHVTALEVEAVCADLDTVHRVRRRPRGEVDTFAGPHEHTGREPVEINTEDAGYVLLRLGGGARGVLWVSQVTAGRKNCLRWELAAEEGSLAWNSERPNELWLGHRDRPNELLLRDPSLLAPEARAHADYPGGHNEGFPDTFKQLCRAFHGWIRAGDPAAPRPFPTFADGHREVLVCEAILRSHREGRWVDVPAG